MIEQKISVTDTEQQSSSPRIFARKGLYAEAEEIVRLYVENLWPIAHIQPDIETVCKEIYGSLSRGQTLVVECDGKIVGCASYQINHVWYSSQEMLFDTGFFIIPSFRKTRATSVLFRALKKEAFDRSTILIMAAGTKDSSVAQIMAKRYRMISAVFAVTR